jgi:predicted transcriptional regulator
MARPLEGAEEETARLLERAGIGRAAARCLAALLRGAPMGSVELAETAGLARQDVTPAGRELVAAGLITIEPRAAGAKGRPSNRYALARTRAEAIAHLVGGRRSALHEELAALGELEKRLS